MAILRIINTVVNSSTSISITFTDNLTPYIVPSNVSIVSTSINVPNAQVTQVLVSGATLNITCLPLSPNGSYNLIFISTKTNPFMSLNGTSRLSQDGVSNVYTIIGPLDPANPVKNYFLSYFKDNIYNIENSETIVSSYINALSDVLARALYDIGQCKNENYLSFNVIDEQKTRAAGPYDRLNQESAYEITRVALTKTGTTASASYSIVDFPSFPITLQQEDWQETLTPNSIDAIGYFNINDLTLNVTQSPITILESLTFVLTTGIYTYDIETYGYQITSSRYDQNYASSYANLATNQIRLNDQVLSDPNFSLTQIVSLSISYQYKNLGIVVDSSTVSVTSIQMSIREAIPPIINIFNLDYAPIVSSSGATATLGGVIWTDPNNPSGIHPAFVTEIPYSFSALPYAIGQYAIDYATGTVYVYGQDLTANGTGPYPPLATYNYLMTYNEEQDYVYDSSLLDLVALPNGNLLSNNASINFSYEEALIPGTDYTADVHNEVIQEFVNNNLLTLNSLRVQRSPVTNVFQIYNQSSGEIYKLNRWNNDIVYFLYNSPPSIDVQVRERASFVTISNELLFINSMMTNSSSLSIIEILLNNGTIINATEDGIASSFNTSLFLSDGYIFASEIWYDRQLSANININNLSVPGQYMVDYTNGIIYCAISSLSSFNIGTVSYKANNISPQYPHLISVDNIYYQITPLGIKNKTFSYLSFADGSIIVSSLDYSDELELNGSSIYQISSGSIGAFSSLGFVLGVTNQINFIRSVYEYDDLTGSTFPLNFANVSTANGFDIQVFSIIGQGYTNVQHDIDGYYVLINENLPYLSANITYSFTVTRVSDSASLWNGSGTIVPGNQLRLTLPNINSPNVGNLVSISWTFTINNLSRVVIDYDKGGFYIDYTYLADEIVVSYEYGDNNIDFRESLSVIEGTNYYVSYKAGALRAALLRNFGTLVNIPELANIDLNFDRERYRDTLIAAMTSFIQGPTVSAIKNIGQVISHVDPQIVESAFQSWSLGSSLLYPRQIETTGSFQMLSSKINGGALIDNQTITFPITSSIRFEEGTFETWITNQWNGIDNDAEITFSIYANGAPVSPLNIFIGVNEEHPQMVNNQFALSKLIDNAGTPFRNNDGIYIYYDYDSSGTYKKWYVEIIDGYVSSGTPTYNIIISSIGNFYNVQSLTTVKPSNMSITSNIYSIRLNIASGLVGIDEGITFVSDLPHYILDLGQDIKSSRLSIYKDASGYLVFRVYDKNNTIYQVSSNVSSWQNGDDHHIAASWKLNTINRRDEMHLFVDGFEAPNPFTLGQKISPYYDEPYRTIDPEEILGLSSRDILSSTDLVTTAGSNSVSSMTDFSAYNIFIGDTIIINEIGFGSYIVTGVFGQTLTLNALMPQSITNGRFVINETSFDTLTDIAVYPNIAVSTIHVFLSGTASGISGTSTITSLTNFTSKNVLPGYMIVFNNSLTDGYTISQVSGTSITILETLSSNISNQSFNIYSTTKNEIPGVRALNPSYSISVDGYYDSILTINNNVFAGDLILINTLGLNHKRVKTTYYVWSNNIENIIMTSLPPPISLNDVSITKIIFPGTAIGVANATLSGGVFTSNNFSTSQPVQSISGRLISATVSGSNVDFSTATTVTINGQTSSGTISETLTFTSYGTLNFVHAYITINYVNIVSKPLVSSKNVCVLTVTEQHPITYNEFDSYAAVIQYSYPINYGYTMNGSGNIVSDANNLFSYLDVNNYLVIKTPAPVAGYYQIIGISTDRHSLTINGSLSSFTSGQYQILNTNTYRSGMQNGFFTFENGGQPGQPYYLSSGFYQFEYYTYSEIKLSPQNGQAFLGSDFTGNNQINAIINEVKIYSTMLTDTRIGESIPANQASITKDFNSLTLWSADSNTLMLINLGVFPFVNSASYYMNQNSGTYFQSSEIINDNFGESIVLLNNPIIVQNTGILNANKQGTIEFWMNPIFDMGNDPKRRYYFDAYGAVTQEMISETNTSIMLTSPASKIISVTLVGGDDNVNYFAGGSIQISDQNAIQEQLPAQPNNSVTVSYPILQVISVTIVGDETKTNYFSNGAVSSNGQIIYLGMTLPQPNLSLIVTYTSTINNNKTLNNQVIQLSKKLPYQNSHVIVTYIPSGLQGDRIAIYKDEFGYINFAIRASSIDYIVRAPTRWASGTWHRVKASFSVNSGNGTDKMSLFIDGYQYNDVLYGESIIYGPSPIVYGMTQVGDGYSIVGNIVFKDTINELFIGTQADKKYPAMTLLSNLRVSNIYRPTYAPYGEPIDVNYNFNINAVFPVTQDLYTTYLLNYNSVSTLQTNFSILVDRTTGGFNFSMNIIDALGIIASSPPSKQALETLINILKPAGTKAFITYT